MHKWFALVLSAHVVGSCVEPISVDAEFGLGLVVVDGSITDRKGPYTVRLSRGVYISQADTINLPLENAMVTLRSSTNESEPFLEVSPGVYETGGAIEGKGGEAYWLDIKLADGRMYESEPEQIIVGGELDDVRFQYEARTRVEPFGEVRADVFNVLVDGTAAAGSPSYTRWLLERVYQVKTEPSLHYTWNPPYTPYKNPFPCSGYILVEGPPGSGGVLEQIGPCECCDCWVSQVEKAPQLSNDQLVQNGHFRDVKIGEVPITRATFQLTYQVKVTQLNISKTAFDYFTKIRLQREAADDLLQPTVARIDGNVHGINTNLPAVGMFWAASAKTVMCYLTKDDLPVPIPPVAQSTLPCYVEYEQATAKKPADWND
jgi:hypothetical protein